MEASPAGSIRFLAGLSSFFLALTTAYWLFEAIALAYVAGDLARFDADWVDTWLTIEDMYPILLTLSAISFVIWSFNAHRNLRHLGRIGIRHQDQATIWWWLVPFANLFMPFRVIYETARGSVSSLGDPEWRTSPLPNVAGWWTGLFLAGLFVTRVPTSMVEDGTLTLTGYFSVGAVGAMLSAIAAALAISLVQRLTNAQLGHAAKIASPVTHSNASLHDEPADSPSSASGDGERGRHGVYCTACGHPFASEDRYCSNCGAPRPVVGLENS